MFDNSMTGAVGYAMHDDLMLRTATRMRLAEAMATRKPSSVRTRAQTYRAKIAEALIALATRIAPPMQEQPARATAATATQ